MFFDGLDADVEFGKTFQEREFTFKQGAVLLNHGSYGAVSRRLQEVQRWFLTEMNAQPDLWFRENVYKYWGESVGAAARFFNCDPKDIVFVTNATEGINAVLKSYDFKEGETILSTSLTYGAIALTCRDVAAQNRVIKSEVIEIGFPIESEEAVLRQYEEYLKAHPNTRMVVIDHITSPSAVLLPVKKLAKICHKYGALVMVDGAHAPGHVPVDLEDLCVDFYTGNFHKWIFTPRGCAVLYVNRKHHDWMKPLVTSHLADGSLGEQFFQAGSRDHVPFVCAKYALEFCERIGGMGRIMAYSAELATEAQEYLLKLFQTDRPALPRDMEAPNMKLVQLPEMKVPLSKEQFFDFFMTFWRKTNIQTITFQLQGRAYLRVSPSIYNYMDEYRLLGQAMLDYIQEINNAQ
ncbi:uncharacterized protein [Haliotis cracherodii]|uniref:uncharacterized protein n=1 Tax=Haliotis cracherodii TaxID=6455 RepID=UPI0039E87C8D